MDSPESPLLHVHRDELATWLVFDHGRVNEMGSRALGELEALAASLERQGPPLLVSTAQKRSPGGHPVFVGGADVRERRGWDRARVLEHVRWQRAVLERLAALPLLHLAVVPGLALGWGLEYLLACDAVWATPEARFGLPETGLGVVPGAGGTAALALRVGEARALWLGMTGRRWTAEQAREAGLVQALFPNREEALAEARRLGRDLARRSPTAMAAFKAAVRGGRGATPEQRRRWEDHAYAHCVATGEAERGRSQFDAVRAGEPVRWGPRVSLGFPR